MEIQKVNLKPKQNMSNPISCHNANKKIQNIKVRIIKAPLVDSATLREILTQRQRALVL